MATSEANELRYSSPEYVATNLHAEWGDIIYPPDHPLITSPLLGNGTLPDGRPGHFYAETAALARTWASDRGIECSRICDIGGGTGRMCFELAQQFSEAREVVLIEPSEQFCVWSRRLLLSDKDFDGWIPIPDNLESPAYLRVPASSLPPAMPSITVYNVSAEETPRPTSYFDMVTSLNVIDRVSDPIHMIRIMGAMLRPGGLLILVSPLHFEEEFTDRSNWVRDLKELLDDKVWSIDEREANIRHAVLHYRRRLNCYLSQVVGAEKIK